MSGYGAANGCMVELSPLSNRADMSTRQATVDHIVDQASARLPVSARKMFGEYALYADGKLVALICDDQLFIKPTDAGRAFIGDVVEAPSYKGAKPSLLIPGDRLENADWLSQLVALTAASLPVAKTSRRR